MMLLRSYCLILENVIKILTEKMKAGHLLLQQRFLNLSYAQKSGIQWSTIRPELSNMLSWSTSEKTVKEDENTENTVGNESNAGSEDSVKLKVFLAEIWIARL